MTLANFGGSLRDIWASCWFFRCLASPT